MGHLRCPCPAVNWSSQSPLTSSPFGPAIQRGSQCSDYLMPTKGAAYTVSSYLIRESSMFIAAHRLFVGLHASHAHLASRFSQHQPSLRGNSISPLGPIYDIQTIRLFLCLCNTALDISTIHNVAPGATRSRPASFIFGKWYTRILNPINYTPIAQEQPAS